MYQDDIFVNVAPDNLVLLFVTVPPEGVVDDATGCKVVVVAFLIIISFASQQLVSDVAQATSAQSVVAAAPINAPVYDAPVHVAANVGVLDAVNVSHFAAVFRAQQALASDSAQETSAQ